MQCTRIVRRKIYVIIFGEKKSRSPWLLTDNSIFNGKQQIYRSAVNMADELLQQAQEVLEGQIVGLCPALRFFFETDLCVQDFEGQKQTELISTVLLAVSGVRLSTSRSLLVLCKN